MKRDELAEHFEAARPRLQRVAQRILGSASESDDALQESWLRVSRADLANVEHIDGWLTTVVARVCFDLLKRRKSRREEFTPNDPRQDVGTLAAGEHPEEEALLADSIGTALTILLDTLNPAERVAFVLHDTFGVPFDEIAPIVERTPEAARQLASRARRRVRGASVDSTIVQQRRDELVRAFFAASRAGNFSALLTLLDPSVAARADAVVAAMAQSSAYWETPVAAGVPFAQGAEAVAKTFVGRARGARHAYIGEEPAAAWVHEGRILVLFRFTTNGERIVGIDLIGDPDTLANVVLE